MPGKQFLPVTRYLIMCVFFFFAAVPVCLAHIISMERNQIVTFAEMIEEIKNERVIFIGEKHDNLHHHLAQLQVVKGLSAKGVKVAIGLEMFRADSQQALDAWVSGNMVFSDFQKVYRDNWTFWEQYADIYIYAREKKIPLIGLNISREITQKVARNGFDGLSSIELKQIPIVQCKINKKYMDFIRRALGGHDMDAIQFKNFCEAQMLWDKIMAINLKEYLLKNPDTSVVVLAGSGHSWKYGIPTQLADIGNFSYRVLLPDIPGRLAAEGASFGDTDYLMLGLDEAPLH